MEICVEFTGIARTLTKNQQVALSVQNEMTCAEIVKLLAQKYTGLLGIIINSKGTELLNSNVFILNSTAMILPDQMDQGLHEGDHLTLLSVIVGGKGI